MARDEAEDARFFKGLGAPLMASRLFTFSPGTATDTQAARQRLVSSCEAGRGISNHTASDLTVQRAAQPEPRKVSRPETLCSDGRWR